MNFLVCICKTPETTAKISFTDSNTRFDNSRVQFIMNPYDEWYALVRALELKEQHGGNVTVINVGPDANDVVIRKALAIGADDAVRIDAMPQCAAFVAENIAEYARNMTYDIILTGKESIDFNGAEVGGMIAEHLNLPYISFVSALAHDGTKGVVTRDIEGGVEIVEVSGPFVISAAKGLAAQRIPNMRGIMMARRKPLKVIEALDVNDLVEIVEFSYPEVKKGVTMVDPEDMDELVRLLREEAKVIS